MTDDIVTIPRWRFDQLKDNSDKLLELEYDIELLKKYVDKELSECVKWRGRIHPEDKFYDGLLCAYRNVEKQLGEVSTRRWVTQ